MPCLTGKLVKYFFLFVLIILPISHHKKYNGITSNVDEEVPVGDAAEGIEL